MARAPQPPPDPAPPVGRTMRAAHIRPQEHGKGAGTIKAGEIVDATYPDGASLSTAARKVLVLLFSKAAGDAWQDQEFCITKGELRQYPAVAWRPHAGAGLKQPGTAPARTPARGQYPASDEAIVLVAEPPAPRSWGVAVRLVGRIVLFPNPRTNLGRCRPRSGPGYPVQGSAPFLRVRIVASRFVPLSETDRLRTPSETMSGT